MLGWIKKITEKKFQNKVGLSQNKLSMLIKDFERLDPLVSGLSGLVLSYVLDDKGEEVLLMLENTGGAGEALELICTSQYSFLKGENIRREFFEKIELKDPAFYLRLAKVYEASVKSGPCYLRCKNLLGSAVWLEIFLREVTHFQVNVYPKRPVKTDFPVHILEEMLLLAGEEPSMVVKAAFHIDPKDWQSTALMSMFTGLKGFKESVLKYKEIVLKALRGKGAQQKIHALKILDNCKIPRDPFLKELIDLSLSKSKTVREKAVPHFYTVKEKALPLLRLKTKEGKSEERYYAVKMVFELGKEEEKDFLKSLSETEKSKKILQLLSEILKTFDSQKEENLCITLPSLPEVNIKKPLDNKTFNALRDFFDLCNNKAEKHYQKWKDKSYIKAPVFIKGNILKKLFSDLQNFVFNPDTFNPLFLPYTDNNVIKAFKKFLERPELELIHVVRLLLLTGKIIYNRENLTCSLTWYFDDFLSHYRKSRKDKFCLRELSRVFEKIGLNGKIIGWNRVQWMFGKMFNYEPEALWPYFWENIEILEYGFDLNRPGFIPAGYYDKSCLRKNSYEILSMFPYIPENFEVKLMEIATGASKSERRDAQKCLEKIPHITERLIPYLSGGRQESRASVALWLSSIGAKESVPHIEKALKNEKQDMVKGAFMTALEELGLLPEKFLDRENLIKESKKKLKKGLKGLEWFPFSAIPSVHWKDNGQTVDSDIIKYFIFKSYKLKSSEPDPLLRSYSSHFNKIEREALGKFILEAWVSYDTRPAYSYEEAYDLAVKEAGSMIRWYKNLTVEDLTKRCLKGFLSQCKDSAIKEKGVLAVAGAFIGIEGVIIVSNYLMKWYGLRAAQCKALLAMLSWIDEPSAIQLLLSVGKRFRTKGIQKEAEKYVNIISHRKGWTKDELADRTIPDAGFDKNREFTLDYGDRTFIIQLTDDLKTLISEEDGKKMKSLPTPRKNDEPEKVKIAKKILSNTRKELKSVLKLQKERLYEAMCTERIWKYEDWHNYLYSHPIAGKYCECLLWGVFKEGKIIKTFRPLSDGTLSDYEDEEVTVKQDEEIKLLHSVFLSDEVSAKWTDHFHDYEISPLFFQLGRDCYRLKEGKRDETEIADFEGYLIEAFILRGQASKFGYTRGAAEDGGWFYTYKKTFPGLSLEALIEFSGNPLPEENRTVALKSLYFIKKGEDNYFYEGNRLALGEVPSVLLSECWNDMKLIADKGSGFDESWDDKVEW